MSETITIWRAEPTVDEYGNPRDGELEPVFERTVLVAPNHGGDETEVGRRSIETGYTIYDRTDAPSGVLATDLIEVRSPIADPDDIEGRHEHLLPIDGLVGAWRDKSGAFKGEVYAVGRADG